MARYSKNNHTALDINLFSFELKAVTIITGLLCFPLAADETGAISGNVSSHLDNNNVTANTNIGKRSTQCPTLFYEIPIVPSARFCQQFLGVDSSSLSYHSGLGLEDTHAHYREVLGSPDTQKKAQGRLVLVYQQEQKTVIISNDGEGSQVDILVQH
jgi:hypothetical protein